MSDENDLVLPVYNVPDTGHKGKWLEITERDVKLLWILLRYPYIRTSFLFPLLLDEGVTPTHLYNRLKKLKEHRLIKIQEESKARHWILQITSKGRDRLFENVPEDLFFLQRRINTTRNVSNQRHARMVSDIMGDLECSLKDAYIPCIDVIKGGPASDLDKPLAIPTRARMDFPDGTVSLKDYKAEPDDLFGKRHEDGTVHYFALEAETGSNIIKTKNFERPSLRRKFLAIRHIAQHKTAQSHWGIPNLRWLFVFKTEMKMRHAIEELMNITDGKGNAQILFQCRPHLFDPQKSPRPTGLFTDEPWKRAGRDDVVI